MSFPPIMGRRSAGLTLVEVLIVIAIMGTLGAVSVVSYSTLHRKVALDDGLATVLASLERARSRALTGVGTTSHGVYVEAGAVTSFAGAAYGQYDGNIRLMLPPSLTVDQAGLPIVFGRLNGYASASTTLVLSDSAGRKATVTVDSLGIISSYR